MPGPWWKMGRKSGRISEFVNDHLHQSRKRRDGSSLVVETGFPTSLVDLFMKNREKLKKPSKRKRSNNNSKPSPADGSFSFPPFSPAPSLPPPVDVKKVDVNVNTNTVPVADAESDDGLLFLVAAFKLFLVVFLVLSTNRLSIGVVTVSAFLFFLSDCLLGKYISDAKRLFTAVARPFLNKLVEYKYGIVPREKESMISVSHQEIVEEESCDHPPEPMPGSSSSSSSSPSPSFSKGKSVAVFQDDDPAVPKIKKRTKMKNKLMKLLGKKSKTGSDSSSPKLGKKESEVASKPHSSSVSSPRYEDDTASTSAVVSGAAVNRDDVEKGNEDLRRRYYFLGLVILVGLVGGRPLAIFLTLLCIFLLVCVEKLMDSMRLSSVWRYFDKSR
ncbi:hypothetical protein M569_01439 [Genlisea aurea]|uniref:Ethylene-responsive nuclear family protein n=1 Tax=Genlisea aurea TaxID=192259 RepID=S8D1S0_9LAMI|nr:hypothetical protein M569_01439 [Genlisea aurea]